MAASHARAARRERQAARTLGTERVRRRRGESAPDAAPVRLASGLVIQAEVKSRKRLPYLLTGALKQAEGYAPDAIPLAVVFQRGEREGLAILRLRDFTRLAGLDIGALPPSTPLRRPRVEVDPAQLTLPGVA